MKIGHVIFPIVENITVGIYEDKQGAIYSAGDFYPAIVFSYYSEEKTLQMMELARYLGISKDDLVLANFEELENHFNIVVFFSKQKDNKKWSLIAEVEIDKGTVNSFKKLFLERKSFIICFGFYRPEIVDVVSLCDYWHVILDSFTEYKSETIFRYLTSGYKSI